ncbi:MAG TPA: LacI family DNA-binding transcriptional regulator [Candidatus Stackebrandtia excrementipullorum]|nr:LacI family DNA-binding transcriptional regulator [Candidatus Stackebrandtia excrementipullorum]
MKATLQTVADAVGVSRSTVSNAYSRPDQLSTPLRERILATAAELGYPGPHAAARSLRKGRAGAVGVLFTANLSYAFVDPYAVQFLRGLAESAERHDTGLLLLPLSHDDAESAERKVRHAVVDGFCVYNVPEWHRSRSVLATLGLPIVTTEYRPQADQAGVGVDDRAACRTVAEHLMQWGHRDVAVVSVFDAPGNDRPTEVTDIDAVPAYEARQRLLGIRDAVVGAGVDWSTVTVLNASANSRDAGRTAASQLLDRTARPSAIIACTDVIALGVIDAMNDRRLRPGVDVSVTGFDDIPEASAYGLSTIRQPAVDRGVIAAELLLDPPPDPADRHVLLPTELVIRSSTGSPTKRR